MKLAYCILVCAFLKVVCCYQKTSNLVDDDSYFDVQRAAYPNSEKNYQRSVVFINKGIIQCLLCNYILVERRLIGRSFTPFEELPQCLRYSSQQCLTEIGSYLVEYGSDKSKSTRNNKRQFDEIDKTDPGFSTLNQIH